MVFFHHGQTVRNDSVQNDQPNQPTIPTGQRIALFFYYHGRSADEATVRLVSSVRSDRIKEQALRTSSFVVLSLHRLPMATNEGVTRANACLSYH